MSLFDWKSWFVNHGAAPTSQTGATTKSLPFAFELFTCTARSGASTNSFPLRFSPFTRSLCYLFTTTKFMIINSTSPISPSPKIPHQTPVKVILYHLKLTK